MIVPLNVAIFTYFNGKKPRTEIREISINNDLSNTITTILCTFIPYFLGLIYTFLFICFKSPNPGPWFSLCGEMLPAHLPTYIADGFLIYICVAIKREHKINPPEYVIKKCAEYEKEKAKEEKIKSDKILSANTVKCKKLLETCGMSFFVKYYKRIKSLPLRDVYVTEDYSHTEKQERLLAAKQIINSDLTEIALNEIINGYGDVLDNNDISLAKSILSEIETTKLTDVS